MKRCLIYLQSRYQPYLNSELVALSVGENSLVEFPLGTKTPSQSASNHLKSSDNKNKGQRKDGSIALILLF